MKRFPVLVLGVLMSAGVVGVQSDERALVAKARAALDSIAASTVYMRSPAPVSVSSSSVFAGITMESGVAGSATNLKYYTSRKTFPVTGGISVAGAKALNLVITWANFEHGGFRIQHYFSSSAIDTSGFYYDGALWSGADTVSITDSVGLTSAQVITPDVAGTMVIRIPDVPGGDVYYFCRITPWGIAHANWITGLSAELRKVE